MVSAGLVKQGTCAQPPQNARCKETVSCRSPQTLRRQHGMQCCAGSELYLCLALGRQGWVPGPCCCLVPERILFVLPVELRET